MTAERIHITYYAMLCEHVDIQLRAVQEYRSEIFRWREEVSWTGRGELGTTGIFVSLSPLPRF